MIAVYACFVESYIYRTIPDYCLLNTSCKTDESLIEDGERLRMEGPDFSRNIVDELPSHIVVKLIKDSLLVGIGLIVEGLPGIVQVSKTVSKVSISFAVNVTLSDE